MNAIDRKVENYIRQQDLLRDGDRVVAGISGGPDSMCMLSVLQNLSSLYHLQICAVHVNHGLRGTEADQDEKFVKEYCKQKGIPCRTFQGKVKELAERQKISLEEAGRNFRYACFERVLLELGWENGKIATAHNQNDVAETFLFHICRGTGLAGLASIPPQRGRIIRPLLCLERKEIENYLKEERTPYCQDQTNQSDQYTRNRIRNILLPYMETEIHAQTVPHIYDLTNEIRETNQYLEEQSRKVYAQALLPDGSLSLDVLETCDAVIRKRVIRHRILEVSGNLKDISRAHVEAVDALREKEVGRQVDLPGEICVIRQYQSLAFFKKRTSAQEAEDLEIELPLPRTPQNSTAIWIPELEQTAEMRIIIPADRLVLTEKRYTKWLDYDKIKHSLKVRTRRKGDYFVLDGAGNRKLIRRFMIDEKIPKEERDRIFLVADGDHIVWIIGGRISYAYRVTEQTERILEISLKGERKDGREYQSFIDRTGSE